MCRLFAQHARPGLDLCEPLCSAENALRFQSHQHSHGWGIGWYEGALPKVRVGTLPAHADEAFVAAARSVRGRVVIAHVRDASVGPIAPENTHPFRRGRWLFAHNGTVARFARSPSVREAMLAEIDADLRAGIRGDTDSERCFLLFLTRLRARIPLDRASLSDVRRALAETTEAVLRVAERRRSSRPSSLNFVVSDGRLLAACRRGRTLHAAADAASRRAVVVASERIGSAAWEEVPEGGFVGTEDGLEVVSGPLRVRARPGKIRSRRGDTLKRRTPRRAQSRPATGKLRG